MEQKIKILKIRKFYLFVIISVFATVALASRYAIKHNPFAEIKGFATPEKDNDCENKEVVKEENVCNVKDNDSLYVGCSGFF